MSQRRKLRRIEDKAKLTAVALNAAPHGCETCRSGSGWRTKVMRELLAKRMIGDSKILCTVCGARWLVSVFTTGPSQEVHIAFKPITNEPSN